MGKKDGKKRSKELAPAASAAPAAPAATDPGAIVDESPPVGTLRKLSARLSGARLCYGKPIEAGTRTIVPVAMVKTGGGYGFGSGKDVDGGRGRGGGGAGTLQAKPVGYIEVGPDGSRFEPIPSHGRVAKAFSAAKAPAAVAGGTGAGAVAGMVAAVGVLGVVAIGRSVTRRRASARRSLPRWPRR